ncbi:tRNA lysidine(34) synthetase TilS [Peptoniphilus mikwangii]|uniref:tRNA lysidine(34) synthetase TilS n=1 Tax=Peptoniphilus mikwangii TaxID=1354300 RepID=UPI0004014194|nr:tRNA lysidine(34) synthetase TilS [Peptoniphilus mikwangii]
MNKKFLENIKKFNMLCKNEHIIVAVSGGADSMFLLSNLVELKTELGLKITVAHINHGVRRTSLRDENFVIDKSEKFGVDVKIRRVDMEAYAKEQGLTDEEAGRVLRYKFFRELSKGKDKIFLAHNANDQAETVLQRIIRGTGIDGLSAMDYVSCDLYRPMLNIKRDEIIDYINKNNIEYVDDETNFMDIYGRNKIRLNVIPYIEENFNENFVNSLIRLSEISSENFKFIKRQVDDYISYNYYDSSLNISDLVNKDKYFISEVLRGFLKIELGTIEGISSVNINDIIEMLLSKDSSSVTLTKGKEIELSYNKIYLKREHSLQNEEFIPLKEGINETVFGKIRLVYNGVYTNSKNLVSIDADKLNGTLNIRSRRNGDRFIPLGMTNYKKLKDFFIDEKIERRKRDIIPLVCDDNEIVWVVPYRLSGKYSVNKDTKNIVNIILEEKNDRY